MWWILWIAERSVFSAPLDSRGGRSRGARFKKQCRRCNMPATTRCKLNSCKHAEVPVNVGPFSRCNWYASLASNISWPPQTTEWWPCLVNSCYVQGPGLQALLAGKGRICSPGCRLRRRYRPFFGRGYRRQVGIIRMGSESDVSGAWKQSSSHW